MIFMLLFNALFGSLVATSTIASLGGGSPEDVALFQHEAASGVTQTAEVVARMMIDLVWPLSLLAVCFTLPIKGLCSLPIPVVELLIDWWMMTIAFSPFGYLFTLLAPGNAVVLTSSAALVSCAFGTGFFGLRLKSLPQAMRGVFAWLSPGCPSLYLLSYGSAIYRPLSIPRAALLTHLLNAGLITQEDDDTPINDVHMETSGEHWERESLLQLLVFGCVLRVLSLLLFTWRSNNTIARWKAAVRDRCHCSPEPCGKCAFVEEARCQLGPRAAKDPRGGRQRDGRHALRRDAQITRHLPPFDPGGDEEPDGGG